ncbi:MAG: hypothetical protein IPJ84_09265 [Bdellovibrionales bacterium]|nr:hypothetical protein [Bdellovibrionales bacterium]
MTEGGAMFGRLVFVVFLSFVSGPTLAAPVIELEHTISEAEGSSWGTDDILRESLAVPEQELPTVFRLPLVRPTPRALQLSRRVADTKLFINDTVFLYRSLNSCVDQKFPSQSAVFKKARDVFIERVSGENGTSRPLEVQVQTLKVDLGSQEKAAYSDCDLLVAIGDPAVFPFKQLPKSAVKSAGAGLPQMVLGLYYRHDATSLPVIVFNPQLNIDFDSEDSRYLRGANGGRFDVDGRSLFFHELAHVLGFSHIENPSPMSRYPALTVMGLKNSQRDDMTLELRYAGNMDIWRYWDLKQTSLYRSLVSRLAQGRDLGSLKVDGMDPGICVTPGEELDLRFAPIGIVTPSPTLEPLLMLPDRIELGVPTATHRTMIDATVWNYELTTDVQFRLAENIFSSGVPFFRAKVFRSAKWIDPLRVESEMRLFSFSGTIDP